MTRISCKMRRSAAPRIASGFVSPEGDPHEQNDSSLHYEEGPDLGRHERQRGANHNGVKHAWIVSEKVFDANGSDCVVRGAADDV